MVLRVLRALNRAYPFVVFAGYALAFLVAFICMFTFPLASLILVIGSVLSLAVVVFIGEVFRGIEGLLSRRVLRRSHCPACRMGPVHRHDAHYKCLGCGKRFEHSGIQSPEQDDEDAAAASSLVAAE
jgi:hypothetical protein